MFNGSNSRGCMAAIFASFSLLAAANAQDQPAQSAAQIPVAAANEHPLMPALRWAREGLPGIERIQDYTATVMKKERIGSKLGEDQYMAIKVRHKPFSVYSIFLAPAAEKGKECLYIEGANNGKMWAHGTGMQYKMFGTVSLDPDGNVAMQNQRYPLNTNRHPQPHAASYRRGQRGCEVRRMRSQVLQGREDQ